MSQRSYDKLAIAAEQNIKERGYWLGKLSGNLVKSSFPYDFKNEAAVDRSSIMEEVKLRFTGEIFSKLEQLSKGSDTKLYMILTAGLAALLEKYTGNKDVVLGTPIYKQDVDIEFVNTVLVLRNQIQENMTFKELLLQVRQNIVEAAENQNYPLEILLEQVGIPYSNNGKNLPLFDVVLLQKNIHDKNYLRSIHYNILFSFNRMENFIDMAVEYNSRLYETATIKRIFCHYHRLLENVLSDVDSRLPDIDIVPEEEKRKILYEFNDTEYETGDPEGKTIHELFAEQAVKTPDNIALVSREFLYDLLLSYRELNEKSERLACFLRNKGIKPGSIIGLMVEKSLEMMVGILGILKAGGAYLPIDLAYPPGRVEYMLKESGAKILLTYTGNISDQTGTGQGNPASEIEHVDILSPRIYEGDPSAVTRINRPGDVAYIIYTSGSTGTPKGVVVEHRNVTAYLNAFFREFAITMKDTALQQASYSFDAFVEEVYPLLLRGGKIAICPNSVLMDSRGLGDFILKHRITFASVTPLLLNEMNRLPRLDSIRLVISGGDVLKKEYATNLLKKGMVYNTYGPTETTVCATYYQCSAEDKTNPPIGKPIPGYRVYILDPYGRLAPIGVPGELCITGRGVSRGYMNNPELTAEKFASGGQKPFCKKVSGLPKTFVNNKSFSGGPGGRFYKKAPLVAEGRKLYKTGDLGRWLADGNIEFLGRIDHQVKIRGFRIEPGEIETVLLRHEAIDAALVLVKEMNKEEGEDAALRYLCAYTAAHRELSVTGLKEYLAKYLPPYMIPSFYVFLDRMPLTPNGKPDLKALESYEPVSGKAAEYIAPETDMEITIAGIWKELLHLDKVSIHDNFFDLGGNSLLVLKAANKIKEILNKDVQYVAMFQYTTIRALSAHLTNRDMEGRDTDKYIEQAETLNRGKGRIKQFISRTKEAENA